MTHGNQRAFFIGIVLIVGFAAVPFTSAASGQLAVEDAQTLFDQAQVLFNDLQQDEARTLLDQLIDTMIPGAESGTLTPGEREVLFEALLLRARAAFNLSDTEMVDGDLDVAIRMQPAFACTERLVSPALMERCAGRRADLVGLLDFGVDPPDAEVQIDGSLVDTRLGPVAVLSGSRNVSVNRPGYGGWSELVEVPPGPDVPVTLDVSLERVSAVLRVMTRPPGATVHVDTVNYGTTEGSASFDPSRPRVLDGYPISEFSSDLIVPNLAPGLATVAITLDGYRTVRGDIELPEAEDYAVHFALERAEGTVVLENLPSGSTVQITRRGETTTTTARVDSGEITLPIGVYDLIISHPNAGYFEGSATVIDRQEYLLPVRLRPTVVMLDVLGDDDVGREVLLRSLADAFQPMDGWTWRDRTQDGATILEPTGITADALRRLANPFSVRSASVDWTSVQATSDAEAPGSVHLLAVLDNDLAAQYADLWVWRSAPGTPEPTRLRVSLTVGDEMAADSVVPRAFPDVPVGRPWLGALLIDTQSEAGPFVASVTAGGPAEAAGLAPGDVIVSIDGSAVASVAEAMAHVVSSSPPLTLSLVRRGGNETVQLTPGAGPSIVSPRDPELAYPAVSASLSASVDREAGVQPAWVWDLSEAATLLEAGDSDRALDLLRRLERVVPAGPGVGRGTVQYWLGLAYMAAGPRFRDQARQSLQQAAAAEGARLSHHDGPPVAPRARARLAQLDGGVSTPR